MSKRTREPSTNDSANPLAKLQKISDDHLRGDDRYYFFWFSEFPNFFLNKKIVKDKENQNQKKKNMQQQWNTLNK